LATVQKYMLHMLVLSLELDFYSFITSKITAMYISQTYNILTAVEFVQVCKAVLMFLGFAEGMQFYRRNLPIPKRQAV